MGQKKPQIILFNVINGWALSEIRIKQKRVNQGFGVSIYLQLISCTYANDKKMLAPLWSRF